MDTLCLRANPLRPRKSPYMPVGIWRIRPVETVAWECGGIVVVSADVRSYPADPLVALVGRVALSDAVVTWTW